MDLLSKKKLSYCKREGRATEHYVRKDGRPGACCRCQRVHDTTPKATERYRVLRARPEKREAQRAYMRRYYSLPDKRAAIVAWRQSPGVRARQFLARNADCTSNAEEVSAIYADGLSALNGTRCEIGAKPCQFVLDHIHGGPAIGLIPSWLNRALTKHTLNHWEVYKHQFSDDVVAYVARRDIHFDGHTLADVETKEGLQ